MQTAKVSGGISGGSLVKNVPPNASSIPDPGRSLGVGNGNPPQYSSLENPMTEEPSGLQPMGLQRVKNNLAAEHEHGNFRRKI